MNGATDTRKSADVENPGEGTAEKAARNAAYKLLVKGEYAHAAAWYGGLSTLQNWGGLALLRYRLFRRARGRTLEVAVGTGSNLAYYPASVSLTAVDLSPEMLAMAERKAAKLGRAIAFRTMDAEALEFKAESFDTVASSMSMCTVPDPIQALREMARVLRPGGEILLLEHGRSSLPWLARRQDAASAPEMPYLGCRKNRHYPSLIREAGLRLVQSHRNLLGVFYSLVATPAL